MSTAAGQLQLVLVSGGPPTDDFAGGLAAVNDLPWGKKAVRAAVAIGQQADRNVLQQFVEPAGEFGYILDSDDDLAELDRELDDLIRELLTWRAIVVPLPGTESRANPWVERDPNPTGSLRASLGPIF